MASPAVARELAADVAGLVDSAAQGRVVVLGSLPPDGRDLDLVARSRERERVAEALAAAGLLRKGPTFALFRSRCAYGVELFAAEQFLPPAACEQLFEHALPLDGRASLARPAPAHALLILAGLAASEGGLSAKRRRRLERILAEDAGAWRQAGEAAPLWGVTSALAQLERAATTGKPAFARTRVRARMARARRALPRRRQGLLVTLSGIDGAGKSSQARLLAESLRALGVDAEVVWNDLLGSRLLKWLAAAPKALLALGGRGGGGMARWDDAPPSRDAPPPGRLRAIWSTIVTLLTALEQRAVTPSLMRGRVVIFDRGPLDLAVRMQVLYRAKVGVQRRLVRIGTPTPDLAFLLDIAAELSLARKQDVWSSQQLSEQAALYRDLAEGFQACRIDGTRPPEEIASEIARKVWLALR